MIAAEYWETRYNLGGTSGEGSYGTLAQFKTQIINEVVETHSIKSVIDFGCGDGNQIKDINCKNYVGFDVSPTAIAMCKIRHPQWKFFHTDYYYNQQADLTLSLDVIFHLTNDKEYHTYMRNLCDAATRYLLIYSTNTDTPSPEKAQHVRHRRFADWIARYRPIWQLDRFISNKYPGNSNSDFYLYRKPTT